MPGPLRVWAPSDRYRVPLLDWYGFIGTGAFVVGALGALAWSWGWSA